MRNRVLFVTEKWCDGSPNVGWTNNFHNTFNSFQQCKPSYNFNTIHIDESYVTYGKHIDEVLPKYCLHWDVHIVFFCLLGDSPLNPSVGTLNQLKELGIKLCFLWPDSGPGWATDTMLSLTSLADLQVTWDRADSEFHRTLPVIPNILRLWPPQDNHLFTFNEYDSRAFKVSFVGSRYYPARRDVVDYLKSQLPELHVSGGQREDKLSPYEYAWVVRQSEIMLNLPMHPLGFSQIKSRVVESMACGTMVVELKNGSTSQLFEPSKDYVEAESFEDMVVKAKFYLANANERIKIAQAGRSKYLLNYTAQHYWNTIFEQLKV